MNAQTNATRPRINCWEATPSVNTAQSNPFDGQSEQTAKTEKAAAALNVQQPDPRLQATIRWAYKSELSNIQKRTERCYLWFRALLGIGIIIGSATIGVTIHPLLILVAIVGAGLCIHSMIAGQNPKFHQNFRDHGIANEIISRLTNEEFDKLFHGIVHSQKTPKEYKKTVRDWLDHGFISVATAKKMQKMVKELYAAARKRQQEKISTINEEWRQYRTQHVIPDLPLTHLV